MISILYKFLEIQEDGTLLNSLYEASQYNSDNKKLTKTSLKKEIITNITHKHRCKNPSQFISKLNSEVYNKDNTSRPSRLYPQNARLTYSGKIQCNLPYNSVYYIVPFI